MVEANAGKKVTAKHLRADKGEADQQRAKDKKAALDKRIDDAAQRKGQ
jgi:hypothetical protein